MVFSHRERQDLDQGRCAAGSSTSTSTSTASARRTTCTAAASPARPAQPARPGNPFPQLAIGQYKVITSQLQGRVRPDLLGGDDRARPSPAPTSSTARCSAPSPAIACVPRRRPKRTHTRRRVGVSREYGCAIGGPIIKDKLHFFLTYEGKEFQTPTTTTGSTRLLQQRAVQQLPAGRCPRPAGPERTCRSRRTCTSARWTGNRPIATASS